MCREEQANNKAGWQSLRNAKKIRHAILLWAVQKKYGHKPTSNAPLSITVGTVCPAPGGLKGGFWRRQPQNIADCSETGGEKAPLHYFP
jgi:hypothetical protein